MTGSSETYREPQSSGAAATDASARATDRSVPEAHPVDFPQAQRTRSSTSVPLERFAEVNIEISVEIGRATMPIGELLQLGEGAVVELHRSVSEPVDIMAQGVRIASGEIVVIDDRFAVRITEIAAAEDRRDKGGRTGSSHAKAMYAR